MTSDVGSVVVTGLGPVTSIGVGCDSLWTSLCASRSGVETRTLPVDVAATTDLPIASMPPASEVPGLKKHLAWLADQELAPYRDLAYTMLATELALADAGLAPDRDGNRYGMVQAFEAPGVEHTVSEMFKLMSTPPPTDRPPAMYDLLAPCFYRMQPFLYVHVVGKAFGLHGFCTSVHNACTSGAAALETAAQYIRSGRAEVMVVMGGEAFDTAVRLEWFRRLEMYARDKRMSPFDPGSSGFYVGEGAGAVVLESASHAVGRGAAPYAAYLGGEFAHQAWKQTIPDVRSARLRDVIRDVMCQTGVTPQDLDLIVPHGASTNLSDGYERICMSGALGKDAQNAVVSAFKPNVGHMLATCSIIETICALLSLKHGIVPPTLHSDPDRARLPFPLITTLTEKPIRTVLKLTTGFTGHDAAALFRKI